MRVKPAQSVTHNPGTFYRPGTVNAIGTAKTQAHARHAVQNTPLYRFLAVAHIGQRPTFDHAKGVFEISALCVRRKRVIVGQR